jgi:hypothetical protein
VQPFSALCVVGRNKTILRTLIDTCASGGNFIDEKTAHQLCQLEEIQPHQLQTPIALRAFNNTQAPAITHSITMPLRVGHHYEEDCQLLITNLGHNQMILGIEWMKTHGCIPNPTTSKLMFIGGFYGHPGAPHLETDEAKETDIDDDVNPNIYLDTDSITSARPKKRRRLHRRTKTKNQRLRELEQHRITSAKTPFRRSTRCTLPAEGDEDEAFEYYDSWEYLDKPTSISLIGAHAVKAL